MDIKVAVSQKPPVLLDLEATLERAIAIIAVFIVRVFETAA